jgi:hypothetical protein
VHDTCLWPMAVAHVTYIHNRLPQQETGLSPYELLSRTNWERNKLQELHVWGCPTCEEDTALDPPVATRTICRLFPPTHIHGTLDSESAETSNSSSISLCIRRLVHYGRYEPGQDSGFRQRSVDVFIRGKPVSVPIRSRRRGPPSLGQ